MLLILNILELGLISGTAIYTSLNILLGIEVLAAVSQGKHELTSCQQSVSSFRVLIPAHNEASGIEKTLKNLFLEVQMPEQICVVADNCTDNTATLARNLGVQVLERTDETRKGKGYALDFGLTHLAKVPPTVVVIVDADCQVKPGTLAKIVNQSLALNLPIQSVYHMALPSDPSPRDRVSAFAVTVKNRVRAGGLSRFGFPIPLAGTGMAFPWAALQEVNVASGHIAEDMKLGIDLAIAGYGPKLSTETLITSNLPSNGTVATSQRTRWEHGHLQILTTYVPQLIKAAWQQKRLSLLIMALDLAIPPLALWVIIGISLTLFAGILAIFAGTIWPLVFQGVADLLLLISILVAWGKWGGKDLPLLQLLAVPLYILWKIPIYFKFVLNPQSTWIRTERDQ
ncbi:MAG: glycosyltransferase [Leptolyngbya sp. SIO1D8]|nr:glycosyltransferase [Leptolyngbya sp. SIO1D8]